GEPVGFRLGRRAILRDGYRAELPRPDRALVHLDAQCAICGPPRRRDLDAECLCPGPAGGPNLLIPRGAETAMKKQHYGTTEDGTAVDVYHLANEAGMRVSILTYGCIIATLEVPDREGRLANVVLGLDTLEGYATRSPHFGAIAGRFANRIAKGRFSLDGT